MNRNFMFRSSRHTLFRAMSASEEIATTQFTGGCEVGAREKKCRRFDLRLCGKNAGRAGGARNSPRPRVRGRHKMADGVRALVSYRETPDQLTAIAATNTTWNKRVPWIVSFAAIWLSERREVAIRAAFKAVMEGKQVAVLAPTTVLAQQHFETFRQRMLDYPVRIEMLSRFRSHAEQRKVLQLLREGGVERHRHPSAHFRRRPFSRTSVLS